MRIILGAVEIDGTEAHRIGFVQELTETGGALERAPTSPAQSAVRTMVLAWSGSATA